MAFCFKRKESVPKAVRRLGHERIRSALDHLGDWRRAEAIHEARKDIKKVRALLRLVRTGIAPKSRRRLARLLQGAARRLSGPRDATEAVGTLRKLSRHFRSRLAPGSLGHVRRALDRLAREATERFEEEEAARTVSLKLHRVAGELEHLELSDREWKALGSGVKTAYARGRRAYQTACADASAENLHAWRKRAKDFWYQLCLLRLIQPREMDAMAAELEALGELLGDDHDLVVLQEAAWQLRDGDAGEGEVEVLTGLIDERRCELRSAEFALGVRIYTTKPEAVSSRLAGYWRAWRADRTPRHEATEATV